MYMLNRIVGIETVVPAMYKAYSENYRIEFYKKNAQGQEEKLILYKNKTQYESDFTEINYLDLEDEKFANEAKAIEHLEALLTQENLNNFKKMNATGTTSIYEEQFGESKKLYNYFKNKKFEERLGEYYQEDKSAGQETEGLKINKTKKRVITYVMLEN